MNNRFTNEEKLACVEREIQMRLRVYPRFIQSGQMTRKQADKEMDLMREIANDYWRAAEKERLL